MVTTSNIAVRMVATITTNRTRIESVRDIDCLCCEWGLLTKTAEDFFLCEQEAVVHRSVRFCVEQLQPDGLCNGILDARAHAPLPAGEERDSIASQDGLDVPPHSDCEGCFLLGVGAVKPIQLLIDLCGRDHFPPRTAPLSSGSVERGEVVLRDAAHGASDVDPHLLASSSSVCSSASARHAALPLCRTLSLSILPRSIRCRTRESAWSVLLPRAQCSGWPGLCWSL